MPLSSHLRCMSFHQRQYFQYPHHQTYRALPHIFQCLVHGLHLIRRCGIHIWLGIYDLNQRFKLEDESLLELLGRVISWGWIMSPGRRASPFRMVYRLWHLCSALRWLRPLGDFLNCWSNLFDLFYEHWHIYNFNLSICCIQDNVIFSCFEGI